MSENQYIRVGPFQYIHVLDTNTNCTLPVEGPVNYQLLNHLKVVSPPKDMIKLPPNFYCIIQNPVIRNPDKSPIKDCYKDGMYEYKINRYMKEIRHYEQYSEPFFLYPGEVLLAVEEYQIIKENQAVHLTSIMEFTDENNNKRSIGDEWIIKGPALYKPRIEESLIGIVNAVIVKNDEALHLVALLDFTDSSGQKRITGAEYLMKTPGAYFLDVKEKLIGKVKGHVLTDKIALHLKANVNFTDDFGKKRKADDMWLLTNQQSNFYFLNTNEKLIQKVELLIVNHRQYCVIVNPMENGVNKLGQKKLVKGEANFFLQPGESLENGIQDILVLNAVEAVLVMAECNLKENDVPHLAGSKWFIKGPREYIPPLNAKIVEKRQAFPLDQNEGVYVRDLKNGEIKCVKGTSYLLDIHEELWHKELQPNAERVLFGKQRASRDKSKAIIVKVEHNCAIQLYDFKSKLERVIFGPNIAMLEPSEDVSVLTISEGIPKGTFMSESAQLKLGPEFVIDVIKVETLEHAKVDITLAYDWHFIAEKGKEAKLFMFSDYIGNACKAMASKIREVVSSKSFEEFHKNASEILNKGVFKIDENGKRIPFIMENGLAVTSIDIQIVESSHEDIKKSLEKLVSLSIEISAKAKQEEGKVLEERKAQEFKGLASLQDIINKIEKEAERLNLQAMEAKSLQIEETGKIIAEAKAITVKEELRGQTNESQAIDDTKAQKIEDECELDMIKKKYDVAKNATISKMTHETNCMKKEATIKSQEFEQLMKALGPETIVEIAKAGPAYQRAIMRCLGLKIKGMKELSALNIGELADAISQN